MDLFLHIPSGAVDAENKSVSYSFVRLNMLSHNVYCMP